MDCKEKLEEAKRLYKFSNDDQKYVLESLFPELKEGEKIKKQIISFLEEFERDHYRNLDFSSWIAWLEKQGKNKPAEEYNITGIHSKHAEGKLGEMIKRKLEIEKQGEQKSINDTDEDIVEAVKDTSILDMVEPKFKVGDTIVEKDFYECGYGTIKDIKNGQYIFTDGSSINIDEQEGWQLSTNVEAKFKVGDWIIYDENIYQIHNIGLKQYYECLRTDGTVHIFDFEYIDSKSHFWTIQDAKDGDVLVTIDDKQPFIYKGCLDPNHPNLPVAYCGLDSEGYFIRSCVDKFNHWWTDEKIQPATKEQCGLLFQKMKKAGYEWDAKNNVLKKIDTYCQEHCKGYQETGKCFVDGECKAKKEAEQKSAWSEEDEEFLRRAIKATKDVYPVTTDWLKSIKDRVQPKQEWSEEDEKMFSELSSSLLINISDQWVKYGKWLKSLKGRITWKPTVEQLASLTIACDRNDRVGFDLTQLLQELKKL